MAKPVPAHEHLRALTPVGRHTRDPVHADRLPSSKAARNRAVLTGKLVLDIVCRAQAARYQMIIMFMIAATTAAGSGAGCTGIGLMHVSSLKCYIFRFCSLSLCLYGQHAWARIAVQHC